MRTPCCGFIGLGLIGGSIARALRIAYPQMRMIAFDKDKATLKLAEADHVINESFPFIGTQFSTCDIIFLCAPVSHNAENLQEIK
ncbi:MAG: prephenate dehydrogenase/arogenate dehydrogenase family protein, partial [Lachnospiraceae bacterium]|nr:prephenate dehydrogenase/arogenate dehydrogenase family protein [Lachnospiraceae bacterium]